MRISKLYAFHSGMIVAGFGEDELFPTLKKVQVDGGNVDKVRVLDGRFVNIERSGESVYVEPFA